MADSVGSGWQRLPVAVAALAPSNARPVLVERDDVSGVDVYLIAGATPGPHVVVLAGDQPDATVPSAHQLVEAGFVLRGGKLSIVSIPHPEVGGYRIAPDSSFGRLIAAADVVIDLHDDAAVPGASPADRNVRWLPNDDVAARCASVARSLDGLGMLESALTGSDQRPAQLSALHTGWFVDLCAAGSRVGAGELLGAVTDRSGAVLQRIEAPHDGTVALVRRGSRVDAGDRLVMLSRVTA